MARITFTSLRQPSQQALGLTNGLVRQSYTCYILILGPRSSADRALASGASCVGSIPTGGIFFSPVYLPDSYDNQQDVAVLSVAPLQSSFPMDWKQAEIPGYVLIRPDTDIASCLNIYLSAHSIADRTILG